MIYQHRLAYLLGLEGIAMLRGWAGDFDREFIQARLVEVRQLPDDPGMVEHPGVLVERGDSVTGYRQWWETYTTRATAVRMRRAADARDPGRAAARDDPGRGLRDRQVCGIPRCSRPSGHPDGPRAGSGQGLRCGSGHGHLALPAGVAVVCFTMCVLLWAVAGHENELSTYEDGVLALLAEHGGTVTSRVRRRDGESGELPLEVQIVELPDEETLTRFLADPRRLAAAEVRDRSVARTELIRVTHRSPRGMPIRCHP